MSRWLRRHPVAGFVVLAYGISYLIGAPLLVAYLSWVRAGPALVQTYLSRILIVYGPGLAALFLARITLGSGGVSSQLRRVLPTRADVPWALLVFGTGIISAASALLISGVPGGELLLRVRADGALLLAHLAFQIVVVSVGEELGWRGWLLPRLLERTTRIRAALIIAAFWGLWHGPLLISSVRTTIMFILGIAGLSILFTWVWAHTHQRLFVVVLAHATVNAPIFFWEDVTAQGGTDEQLLTAWYTLEVAYATGALLLLLFTWKWWLAKPTSTAESGAPLLAKATSAA